MVPMPGSLLHSPSDKAHRARIADLRAIEACDSAAKGRQQEFSYGHSMLGSCKEGRLRARHRTGYVMSVHRYSKECTKPDTEAAEVGRSLQLFSLQKYKYCTA